MKSRFGGFSTKPKDEPDPKFNVDSNAIYQKSIATKWKKIEPAKVLAILGVFQPKNVRYHVTSGGFLTKPRDERDAKFNVDSNAIYEKSVTFKLKK